MLQILRIERVVKLHGSDRENEKRQTERVPKTRSRSSVTRQESCRHCRGGGRRPRADVSASRRTLAGSRANGLGRLTGIATDVTRASSVWTETGAFEVVEMQVGSIAPLLKCTDQALQTKLQIKLPALDLWGLLTNAVTAAMTRSGADGLTFFLRPRASALSRLKLKTPRSIRS
ncbi:hypothetical protein EVAR_93785_1 [Eumeta japonica]|uniref:Uncharacterized protein n=1 Tax=Eumeta variegata TaxID=151549 RepID=A0A4C1VCS0_EUMVA|nr:hypothetical protein EVAR_93785_1 [Eumeta japonica]